jgi:adhesin transport system outer membrane protein
MLAVVALGSMPSVQAQGLADTVREALRNSPDIAEARNRWLARTEEIREAQGGYRPSIDLDAGIGYESTNSPGTRAAGRGTEELTRRELGVSVRQMLFDGWGTRSEVQRQQAREESAAARLLATGEATALAAVRAYTDLGRYQAIREISDQSLATHLRIEDQIRLRSEAGVGRRADYDQVKARVALAEVNLIAADVNLRDARSTFERVVGRPASLDPIMLDGLTPEGLPASEDEALTTARGGNPLLEVAAADILAARAQADAARQNDYPRLDLELGARRDADIDGVEGDVEEVQAMLRLRYNLYRGGADSARKRVTAYNLGEAQDVRDRALRELQESVRLAWAAYQATRAQLPLLERQVDSAVATRDAYEQQFNIGQRTLLDLLNSENEVFQARQAVVEAKADNTIAQFRLIEAMGELVDRLGVGDALASSR